MGITEKYLPYYTVKNWKNWDGNWKLIEDVSYVHTSPSIVIAKLLVAINQELEKCKNNRCEVLPDIDYYILLILEYMAQICGLMLTVSYPKL